MERNIFFLEIKRYFTQNLYIKLNLILLKFPNLTKLLIIYNDKISFFNSLLYFMKKYLIFLVLILSHFSVYSEGVKLSCTPNDPVCVNCPEYHTLFPLEEFSTNSNSLNIEADQSELLEGKYLLNGNVEVNSEKLYLAADDVEVSSADNSLLATGNVRFQDEAYLITGDLLSATRDEDENLIATATKANYQDFGAGQGGANGYTDSISKTSTTVLLKNSTYSLCPVNKNDWLIDADQI